MSVRELARRTAVRKGRGTNVRTIGLKFEQYKGVGANPTVVQVSQKTQLDMIRLTPISVALKNISSFCITGLDTQIRVLLRTVLLSKLAKVVSVNWGENRV